MSDATNTLDEMCELVIDCPHFTPEWTTSGYLVIRNQNIRDGRLDLSERSYTHLADFERRIRRAKPRAGDIIFTREAPMGEVCLVPEGLECCVGQRQVLLRPGNGVDHRYLFYALRSPAVRHQIFWNEGTGSTVSNVRIPVLKAIKIPRMGHAEAGIGELLGSLDEKIDLNRRMNETLEAMAQAIFRDWFVDFGPVRRKMAAVIDPVAIMGGLTPDPTRAAELAGLFPDSLGEDDLPVGWALEPVTAFATIRGGKQLEKQHIHLNGPNPVFGGAGVMGFSILSNAEGYVITVGRVGAYCGQFFGHRGAAWVNNNASLITPHEGVAPEWLLLALRNSDIDLIKRGAAQPFVSNGDVGNLPIMAPGLKILEGFGELIKPLFLMSEARDSEAKTLAETRDYLLPRLMSGEVRVGDAALEIAA